MSHGFLLIFILILFSRYVRCERDLQLSGCLAVLQNNHRANYNIFNVLNKIKLMSMKKLTYIWASPRGVFTIALTVTAAAAVTTRESILELL